MAPAKTRKRKSDQGRPAELPVESSASEEQRKLPVRAKDGDSSDSAKPTSAQGKGTMVVFGDDDDQNTAPVISAPSKAAVPVPEKEEDDEDSDDEAPEAVSTSKVASDMKKSSQAAQKAAKEQAAAQKRKRQERDNLFKQQAEERKKLEEEAKAKEETSAENDEPAESLIQQRQTEKAPNLLPAEFLTDSSSEDEGGEDEDGAEERPRKRRVAAVERSLARQDRGPRDERIGSTVYRVARKSDERMTPKLKKHAKSSKDLLLKRNRGAIKQRSGFFVK
ncbi:hypothetical protein FSARC_12940 [Fusarium sarcochroum]|uniref:U3 snorna associated n=1 Tax=Fusarium sarcochroum TaxID=1208366 RepID=A0A8H4T522_9HYPO|nr:hypothetical protein FSARC_12940 [Fusarium sarcochroum]